MSDVISAADRRACSDQALHSYGTGYIFEQKSASLRRRLKALSFFGIASPASLGAVIGTYNLSQPNIHNALYFASTVAIAHLLTSIWSLVSGWERDLSSYLDLKQLNYELANKYEKLGKNIALDEERFRLAYISLEESREWIRRFAEQHDIKQKEKVRGMRYALRKYQRPCAACGKVPESMKRTKCGVCGKF